MFSYLASTLSISQSGENTLPIGQENAVFPSMAVLSVESVAFISIVQETHQSAF